MSGKIDPVRALWTALGSHHTDQFVPFKLPRDGHPFLAYFIAAIVAFG